MGNFSDHSLEGKFPDQQVSGLLILSDFSKGNSSWFESVGFLDAGGDGGGFSGNFLGNKLFSRDLLGG